MKIISGIEPFNEIWYKNCFYSAFFPIIIKYAGTISPYLLNEVYTYELDSKKNLNGKIVTLTEFPQLLDDYGILMKMEKQEEQIIDAINNNIENLIPTIIYVDCYYEEIRDDTYQKEHIPHALLIYGVDFQNKQYNVLEHSFKDSLIYQKKLITFKEIEAAYLSFCKRYMAKYNNTFFSYFQINKPIKDIENIYMKKYKKNIFSNYDFYIDNITKIDEYRLVLLNDFYKLNIQEHIDNMNKIIMFKKIELYRSQKCSYLGLENLKFEEIIRLWGSVRAILLKFNYCGKITEKSLAALDFKLKKIIELEKRVLGDQYEI